MTDFTPPSSKPSNKPPKPKLSSKQSAQTLDSLLGTLDFLEAIGAGETITDELRPLSSASLQAPAQLFTDLKNRFQPEISSKDNASPRSAAVLTASAEALQNIQFKDPVQKPTNTDQVHKVHLKVQALNQDQKPLQNQSDLIAQAEALAASALDLEDLRQKMSTFEGCSLRKTAHSMVFGDGNPKAPLMLIGEAPGADEDRQGLPFVGASGHLLDRMLSAIGLSRDNDYYVSNIIPWRPPGNRPPTREETALCLPFIRRHIQLVNPKYIICIGATAAHALLSTKETMGRLRGKWLDYKCASWTQSQNKMPGISSSEEETDPANTTPLGTTAPASIIPTTVLFHPSYLMRSPSQKRFAWQDLQKIEKYFLGNK